MNTASPERKVSSISDIHHIKRDNESTAAPVSLSRCKYSRDSLKESSIMVNDRQILPNNESEKAGKDVCPADAGTLSVSNRQTGARKETGRNWVFVSPVMGKGEVG